jgi:transposase
MASREKLTDEEWSSIYAILLNNKRVYTISENKCRDLVNAVVWIFRSGAQWQLLPASQGKWNSVFKRFDRWCSIRFGKICMLNVLEIQTYKVFLQIVQ